MNLTVKEALELIKKDSSIVILDVRTKEEFAEEHLDNSINIDFLSDSFEKEVSNLDKNKKYLVHCRSGSRSFQAREKMIKLGFKTVYNVDGFIFNKFLNFFK